MSKYIHTSSEIHKIILGKKVNKNILTSSELETDHDFTLPVKLAERGMPTAKSALPDPVKSPMAKE